jgi:benzylsuccinate CoA-transferase BbsE subunit
MGALTALVHRDATGIGQRVDLSMHAAANVTTESGTFQWLVAGETIQRQTGRHAAVHPSMPVQTTAADGRHVTTGFLPHSGRDLEAILDWMTTLGIRDGFDDVVLLEMGVERGGIDPREMAGSPEAIAILGAARNALHWIAANVSAYDFFVGSQERDMQCGIIYSPEEALQDPHFVARAFPTPVFHEQLGRAVVYPGAPFKMSASPWSISGRAPYLGEHNREVLEKE